MQLTGILAVKTSPGKYPQGTISNAIVLRHTHPRKLLGHHRHGGVSGMSTRAWRVGSSARTLP